MVTDSAEQKMCVLGARGQQQGGSKPFVYDYARMSENYGLKLAAVSEPTRWIAISESGVTDEQWNLTHIAYGEYCKLGCAGCSSNDFDAPDHWSKLDICASSQWCAANSRDWADQNYRKTKARHFGGVNLGFLDGSARWYASEAILGEGGPYAQWFRDPDTRRADEFLFSGPFPAGPTGQLCMMPGPGEAMYYK